MTTTFSEMPDWVLEAWAGHVALTSAAARAMCKAEFEDIGLVARLIAWLATDYRETRLKGGAALRVVPGEDGIFNTPCGGDAYQAVWQGRRYEVDWHLKTGSNTRDPRYCLRIYFFWEPESEQVVIDHLPGHRTTSIS